MSSPKVKFLSIKSMACALSRKCLIHISFIVDFPTKFRFLLEFISISSYFFKLFFASRESLQSIKGSLFRQTIQSQEKTNVVGGNILFKKSEWGGCQQIPHHLWSKKTQLKEKSLK